MATANPIIGSVIVLLLELPQADGIERHQSNERDSERDECEIEHDRLLSQGAWYCPLA